MAAFFNLHSNENRVDNKSDYTLGTISQEAFPPYGLCESGRCRGIIVYYYNL